MKTKKIILASLLATACAGYASAQTTLHITGSTAFRKATMVAIENLMGGAGNVKGFYISSAPVSGGELGANQVILQGNISGASNPVTVKCQWSGSTGGIQTVTQGLTLTTWLPNSDLPGTNVINGASTSANGFESSTADVTMSDGFQSSSNFKTPVCAEHVVGVVPFVWCRNNGAPSTLNNMTQQLARAVQSGPVPLSLFTGLNSDEGTFVGAIGRDPDSGTRLDTLDEPGYGSNTPVYQFEVITGGSTAATWGTDPAYITYPQEVVNGITIATSNGGYASGSGVATALAQSGSGSANVWDTTLDTVNPTNPTPADDGDSQTTVITAFTGMWFVSGPGVNDAATAVAGGAAMISYNGVTLPYNAAGGLLDGKFDYTVIREGQYSFWSYEHLYYLPTASTTVKTLAGLIVNQIHNHDAPQSGILLTTMNVGRTVEGGAISAGAAF